MLRFLTRDDRATITMNDIKSGRPKRRTITDQEALQFHSQGRPGKLEVIPTKPMATQRDLSLAYSRRASPCP